MWNPFRRVDLKPVLPQSDTKPAIGQETEDADYRGELETLKLRSLLAKQQITMIHEQLASSALCHMRGGNICHD